MRVTGLAILVSGLLLGLISAPAHALDVNPEQALIGPVRYTQTSGAQDPVYGAPFFVIADAFASNPATSDDTVVMTLNSYPSANATIWLRKTNGVFPAAGATADDSLNAQHLSTTPARLSSMTWFSLVNGSAVDDTVLKTNIAVNAPGTYAGTITAYEGSASSVSAATVVQTTSFSFTTAGAPTTMVVTPSKVPVIADPNDQERSFVAVLDANGKPTQITTVDTIVVSSSASSVATAAPSTITAADFDDTLPNELGAAIVTVSGSTASGSATVTLTPRGTLPNSGVTPQSIAVTSAPLSSTTPGPFVVTYPFDQIVEERGSTDDTLIYDVNDAFITNVIARTSGATPNSGVIAYVTAAGPSWVGLQAMDSPDKPIAIPPGSVNVPVVLRADSTGQVRIMLQWASVADGEQITIRLGTGNSAAWTVIKVLDPELEPTTMPYGHVLAKTGDAIEFTVKLTDNFGNPYPGYLVNGRAFANAGFPAGPPVRSAPTDAEGITTLTVDPPDDTYVGNARINFATTLPSGLPYAALNPPQVLVTYSATGNPTSLTVAQAQSNPSPIGPTSRLLTYPHIVVPFTGEASTADGTPGTWTVSTSSGAANGTMASFLPAVTPATMVHVTSEPDVKLSTYTSEAWNGGESDLWIDSGSPVYAYSTKVGTHTINFTVGSLTTTALLKVSTAPIAAYSIAIRPGDQTLPPGGFGSVRVDVTDAFGNPVPRTTDDTGAVTVAISGQALLTGFTSTTNVTTDDSGQASLSVIAARATGEASLTAVPKAPTSVLAWQPTYEPPSGFPTPVTQATANISVEGTKAAPSITITGARTTIQGKSGIEVEGTAVSIGSATLTPWVKLAGQKEYAAGKAVVTPAANGTFSWSRKTGKKAYVYFTTADLTVRSNMVTIPQ
ncbi:MAG: hypothetical protein ACR2KE_07185 [Candidatus Nanopelagicales bacterium]